MSTECLHDVKVSTHREKSGVYQTALSFNDHRKLGASEGTINQEIQRYQQLESVAVNDIRRDVRKKLRRSSMRVSNVYSVLLVPVVWTSCC